MDIPTFESSKVWKAFAKAFPTVLEDVYGADYTPDVEMDIIYAYSYILLKFRHIHNENINVSEIRYKYSVEKETFVPFTPTLLGDDEFKEIACTLYAKYVSVAVIAEILDTTTTKIYSVMNKCKV